MPGSLVRKLEHLTPLSDLEKQIAMRAPVRGYGMWVLGKTSYRTEVSQPTLA